MLMYYKLKKPVLSFSLMSLLFGLCIFLAFSEITYAQYCGIVACPEGETCVDDPRDRCDSACDSMCAGICIENPLACNLIACPDGMECVDDPRDDCKKGTCPKICVVKESRLFETRYVYENVVLQPNSEGPHEIKAEDIGRPDSGELDGHTDVVFISNTSEKVVILYGKGDGSFEKDILVSDLVNTAQCSIDIADYGGDEVGSLALKDISFSSNDQYKKLLISYREDTGAWDTKSYDCTGECVSEDNWCCGIHDHVATDLNCDGLIDIAIPIPYSSIFNFWMNRDNQLFEHTIYINGPPSTKGGYSATSGDYDNDGFPDIAEPSGDTQNSSSVLVLNNDPCLGCPCDTETDPNILSTTQYSTELTGYDSCHIITADFNNDGSLDIAQTTKFPNDVQKVMPEYISVFHSDDQGSFLPKDNYECREAWLPKGITAGYFNNDNLLDIAAGSRNNTTSIFLNDGPSYQDKAYFHLYGSYAGGSGNHGLAAADFNEDGYDDLASADLQAMTVSIMLNNGDSTFPPIICGNDDSFSFKCDISPYDVVSADFNGDGDVDLAVANSNGDQVHSISIFEGSGDGNFAFNIKYDFNTNDKKIGSIALGDFDADTNTDIAVSYKNGNLLNLGSFITVYYGNGHGAFSNTPGDDIKLNDNSTTYVQVITGDFNADNKDDIAAICNDLIDWYVLIRNEDNNGFAKIDYQFENVKPIVDSDSLRVIAIGCLNEDNNPDLAISTYNNSLGYITIMLGTGESQNPFNQHQNCELGGSPKFIFTRGITLFDIDNDSDIDIVTSNQAYDKGSIRIMRGEMVQEHSVALLMK